MSAAARDFAERLRSDRGDALTQALLEAPAVEIDAALGNPALEPDQLLLTLRRQDLGSDFLGRVANDPKWVSTYLVKAALVAHPHTPKVVAMTLAKYLFWRDLVRIVSSLQVNPAVRRMAEVLLRDRVAEISLGERVALARMAPQEVIKTLRADQNERVIAALLANPRLTEDDAQWMASYRRTPPQLLALLARAERWRTRHGVKLALVRNPRTPRAAALALLATLVERDLRGVAELPDAPPDLRSAARKLLAERQPGA